jgi:hypothetical protein
MGGLADRDDAIGDSEGEHWYPAWRESLVGPAQRSATQQRQHDK